MARRGARDEVRRRWRRRSRAGRVPEAEPSSTAPRATPNPTARRTPVALPPSAPFSSPRPAAAAPSCALPRRLLIPPGSYPHGVLKWDEYVRTRWVQEMKWRGLRSQGGCTRKQRDVFKLQQPASRADYFFEHLLLSLSPLFPCSASFP